nr:MAG TPA: hypothetical protein [Caudoviricetes sp.]
MLTKEERETIAERLRNRNEADYYDFYEAVTGAKTAKCILLDKDVDNIANVILDLCDTSNMIELPLDKDGEVIHINDVVYDSSMEEYQVECIKFFDIGAGVVIRNDDDYTITQPNRLTHKNPVTVQLLSERMQEVIDDYGLSVNSDLSENLLDIANKLKELAGKNE